MFGALRVFKVFLLRQIDGTSLCAGALFLTLSACTLFVETSPMVSRSMPQISPYTPVKKSLNVEVKTKTSDALVKPLRDGLEALGNRLNAIDQAQKTLDVSLFILREDDAGHLFVSKVLNAADRGVNVRLLFDDLFNRRTANQFFALDNHPNIEVRVFNPYSRLSPTLFSFIVDYEKSRRRMHSRFQISDNLYAIIGGRNIADEYFADNGTSKFLDFEIGVRGEKVKAISEAFELYWTDKWSEDISSLQLLPPMVGLDDLRVTARRRAEEAWQGTYRDLQKPSERRPLKNDGISAKVSFVSDVPGKIRRHKFEGRYLVSQSHYDEIARATEKVLIVTPYFIPTDKGASLLERLSDKGIRVEVVTNSLASTNHVSVHGGYSQYRARLLEAGVKVFELKPFNSTNFGKAGPILTLHGKYTVIDGKTTVVTTMNFDPISITGNLESSVTVHSASFARLVLSDTKNLILNGCYRLALNSNGNLVWYEETGLGTVAFDDEPGASIGRNFISDFVAALKIEGLL